ncbi:MAG: ABC transporter permease [Litorilinea sp.]|uniref:Carbohydrate ABC transporter permease n=2 Tax=Litorilinea aerophila TaxID=1204385 RepID=A0A540V9Z7_9CHLR|nr:MAG: ABC transporter permease [Litorilinea sp.]
MFSNFIHEGPRKPVLISTRVDKIHPRARLLNQIRVTVVTILALILLIPIFVMIMTAFKSRADVVSVPPKIIFEPTLEGFVYLLTERAVVPQSQMAALQAAAEAGELNYFQRIALRTGQIITGPSDYVDRLRNSVIIAGLSTLFSVILGVFAAYAFSRFPIPGKDDLLFFILSTRMLPPVVVTIPLFLMYRQLKLHDTHLGMILLYTVFNLSLAVWLLKGFMDEIPTEYEDAAMVDGYTRFQAFYKIVLPQAATGIAATTVFCLIFAWNEYAFALMLTSDDARTAPPSIATMLGRGGIEWSAIAAGSLGFLIPVVFVTFLLRNHLLRGVTFGAVRR